MSQKYSIHPRIGIARLGNSQQFYLGPEKTGGLPTVCDQATGDERHENGVPVPVNQFKDSGGAILRQAARFRIYRQDENGESVEVTLADPSIAKIEWTAHIANKKAIWYQFSELQGDLEFGPGNSYENQQVPLNNAAVTDQAKRKQLIIDPGPRSVTAARNATGQTANFAAYPPPDDYPSFSFPQMSNPGMSPVISTLGNLLTDSDGRLLLLGGLGTSTGTTTLASFAGGDNWWDDIADGYVAATLHLADGSAHDLEPAWVIVGSPKYAPELVNLVTLDDTTFDIAVRFLGYDKELYDESRWPGSGDEYDPCAGFNPDFRPNYERDLLPIFQRPDSYRWVAQIPTMVDFSNPRFDLRDPSPANESNRRRYFSYFRVPVPPEKNQFINQVKNGPNTLFGEDDVPLMPLNSGDNSVSNTLLYKFLTYTPTQYFFLRQWADGKFELKEAPPYLREGVLDIDRQVLGNLVGAPFCPGIETTWIVRAPQLYRRPYSYEVAHWDGNLADLVAFYRRNGLSLVNDPQTDDGCEPGDLTKRMAIPWQADFFQCTVEQVSIKSPINQSFYGPDSVLVPPAYFVYWWPPQSPMYVVAGDQDPGNQVLDAYVSNQAAQVTGANGLSAAFQSVNPNSVFTLTAAGQPVAFARGINSFNQMPIAWADLGFIVNVGNDDYRNFVETERNETYLAQWALNGFQ